MKTGRLSFKGNATPAASGVVNVGTKGYAFASGVFDSIEMGAATYEREYNNGSSGSAATIVWPSGNKQCITLTAAPCTLTFVNPNGACNLVFRMTQGGNKTVVWPSGAILWPAATAPTLSTASGSVDIATFYYNGQSYYGMATMEFS